MASLEFDSGSFKVTYMITFPNSTDHVGRIKIGDATYHTSKTIDEIIKEAETHYPEFLKQGIIRTPEIDAASRSRIKEYTNTADVKFDLGFSGLNIKETKLVNDIQQYSSFRDYDVHDVLIRSGFKKRFVTENKKNGEWFDINLDNAVEGFKTTCAGKSFFIDCDSSPTEITLREEQKQAVRQAKRVFSKGTIESPKSMLWNAIMRFGKTITSYKLIEEIHESENIQKVLILTHRPVVSAGWFEDFIKVFGIESDWQFSAKQKQYGISWDEINENNPFFYFASIQDLRGSFNLDLESEDGFSNVMKKNQEIFDTEFDMIIIDEGHEGVLTELAQKLMSSIKTRYKLHLSGTPFNIIDEFEEDDVYNWTYVDERKANERWIKARNAWDLYEKTGGNKPSVPYPGESNPYGKLPSIEIRTFNVSDIISEKDVQNIIKNGNKVEFRFIDFFKVDKSQTLIGKNGVKYHPFVNNKEVMRFLNTLFENDEYEKKQRGFPYSTNRSKELFAHTLWMLPSVDSAVTLKEMLNNKVPEFYVVNATADNDGGDALESVRKAIDNNPYTITLSVGKLTTGTTVPEWTGVFMLNDMSSPMLYLQTIFRVKSSGSLKDGRQKEIGYVFDFSPNRCLKMISHSAALSVSKKDDKGKDKNYSEIKDDEQKAVEETLNYLPILSYKGTYFEKNDSNSFMQALNSVYISQNVRNGFTSPHLFDVDMHNISKNDAEIILEVESINKASGYEKNKNVTVSESELTTKDNQSLNNDKNDKDKTPKEKEELSEAEKRLRKDRENARNIANILTGVAIRIPLLVFAHNHLEDFSLNNFPKLIDDDSWDEFMPKGFTKEKWAKVSKFFNKTIFEGSCKEIIDRVRAMDIISPLERVRAIAELFATFKNPDKETVLTPWKIVNMQVSQTLGGYRWVDNDDMYFCNDGHVHSNDEINESNGELVAEPKFVNPYENDSENSEIFDNIQQLWDSNESTFYDINSKTALYPLFAAATLFKKKLDKVSEALGYEPDLDMQNRMWNKIVTEQIFVNVRVDYSKSIAQRVLLGYNTVDEINCSVIDVIGLRNLLKIIHEDDKSIKKLTAEDINNVISWVLLGVKDKENMSVDDRLNLLDKDINKALKKVEEAEDEKFTAVLSNPPYQSDRDDGNGSTSVYHHFMNFSKIIGEYVSMIYPARWMNGGRGEDLDSFRDCELSSPKYNSFYVISDESKVFSSATIKGGINYFLWINNKNHNEIYYSYNGISLKRDTLLNGAEIMIQNNEVIEIVSKIRAKNQLNVFSMEHYGGKYKTPADINLLNKNIKENEGIINVYYSSKGGGVRKSKVPANTTNKTYSSYKAFASKTADPDSTKTLMRRPGRIFVAEPGDVCSGSFIQIGDFSTEQEAINSIVYVKTNFATFLFGAIAITQDATKKFYKLIPDVDFATGEIKDKPETFLDFDSPETLDEQLAKIYELTEEEQELMAKSIKPWKDKLDVDADGLY